VQGLGGTHGAAVLHHGQHGAHGAQLPDQRGKMRGDARRWPGPGGDVKAHVDALRVALVVLNSFSHKKNALVGATLAFALDPPPWNP
jgi:hypothetical protein